MAAARPTINDVFARCNAANKAAYIPYVTAGYPTREDTVPVLLALEKGGADIIELGMPFSDPLADGGTIQRSSHVALTENNVTFADCLAYVRDARAAGLQAPIIVMGYYNPFLQYGEVRTVADAKAAGIDGFIVVDLQPEGGAKDEFLGACRDHGLAFVPLVAPTSTEARLRTIAAASAAPASGAYIYCVSVAGVTGARKDLPPDLGEFLARVRAAFGADGRACPPLAVGFGLSTQAHVAGVRALGGDGAVMGSAVIKALDAGGATVAERAATIEAFVANVTGRDEA